jgi:uncharacterized protein DUF3996
MRSARSQILLVNVCALVGFSAIALAQSHPDVECKKTETQPECHTRLKCKANEELEDCQKRLLTCKAGESLDDCKKRVGSAHGNGGQQGGGQQGGQGNGGQGNGGQQDNGGQGNGDQNNRRDDGGRNGDNSRDEGRGGNDGRDRDDRGGRRGRGGDEGGGGGGGRRRDGGGGGGFEPNKKFGLGLELGEPSGLNGKVFVSRSGAIDFGVGYIYRQYYYGDGLHLYADYLFHPALLASTSSFELPFYIGPGLRYWDFHYCYMGLCDYGGSAIGIRLPLGISFDFNNAPLDIFIQLVPVLDFLSGDYYNRYGDREHFGVDFSVGLRLWFK